MSDQSDPIEIPKIVLIEKDLLAQRLIVTWEKAYLEYGALLDVPPAQLEASHKFTAAWSRICGVDIDDIEKRVPVLFENGLLFDDGSVSGTAKGYVTNRLISEMPKVTG